MLRWRLLFGTLLIVALVGLCRLDATAAVPGVYLLPIAILAALLATQELLGLLAAAGIRPMPWLMYVGNVLLVAYPWAGEHAARYSTGGGAPGFSATLLLNILNFALGALLFAVFLVEMRRYREPGRATANLAGSVFALLYVGVMLMSAVALRMDGGIGVMAAWIIVVKMGDTGAYTVGRLIGRHKLAPRISPGKTLEGAFGDLAFSCLGAWLAFRWIVPWTTPEYVALSPQWGWLVFGLLVGAAGMVGDLAESLLKRDVGRKDSSDWMPGFGGILDILDSLLLSAPVAYFCWASGLIGR